MHLVARETLPEPNSQGMLNSCEKCLNGLDGHGFKVSMALLHVLGKKVILHFEWMCYGIGVCLISAILHAYSEAHPTEFNGAYSLVGAL